MSLRHVLFAVTILVGCADPAGAAHRTANYAAGLEAGTGPLLERKCTAPMERLAREEPSDDRKRRGRELAAKCDKLEIAYDAVLRAHVRLNAFLMQAESDAGVTVGKLIDATAETAKSAAGLAAAVEELK